MFVYFISLKYLVIQNGVRQGCAAAPELFNCVIDHILNETHHAHPFGISYARKTLSDVAFADDAAVLSDNLDQLKSALETLSCTASRVGLQINWKKTKIMSIEKTASAPLSTVEINGQAVDVVRQFTYLGSIVSSSGTLDAEISARSAKASSVFGRLLGAVFHKPQISRHTKARIYNATVSSIMLYSSEKWPITQTQLRRVDAVQARHLRRVEGFKWYDKIRNTKILKTFKLANFSTQVEARSLRGYGHLLRLPLSTPARIILDFNPSENGWKALKEGHALDGLM